MAAAAAQEHIAEVLELGRLGMGEVPDLARHDLGLGGTREEQELLDLMRADIAQDAAILGALVEPGRAWVVAQTVRAGPDRLDDAADGTRLHQPPGLDGGPLR